MVSKIDKLISKLKSDPKDYKFSELQKVFEHFGYTTDNAGRTSGSIVSFISSDRTFVIHRPHPGDEMQSWAIRKAVKFLREEGRIE